MFALTLWPRISAYRSRGQSRQAERGPGHPEASPHGRSCPETPQQLRKVAVLCPPSEARPCQARARKRLVTGPPSAVPKLFKAWSQTQNNKEAGEPPPQDRLLPPPPRQIQPGGNWMPPGKVKREGCLLPHRRDLLVVPEANGFLCGFLDHLEEYLQKVNIHALCADLWPWTLPEGHRPQNTPPSTAHCPNLHDLSADNLRFPFFLHLHAFSKNLEQ